MRPFSFVFVLASWLAVGAAARGDSSVTTGEDAGASAPVLRVELDASPHKPDIDVPTPQWLQWKVRALVLVAPNGKTLWRRAPPQSMAFVTAESAQVKRYRASPRMTLEELGFPFTAVAMGADAIVVISLEQLVVFARSDGRTLHDETVGVVGFGSLPFKRADVTVTCGARRVTRRVGNAPWLIDCGPRLVYYFVQGIALFDTGSWTRLTGTMFPDVTRAAPRYTFELDGAVVSFATVD